MEIKCKSPWPKVQFRSEDGTVHDGYLYYILGDGYYISQNQYHETMGLAQNWIVGWRQIIKFYDPKYGFQCTCGLNKGGADGVGQAHTLVCGWSTINDSLL